MEKLRMYFAVSLVWLMASLSLFLISCDKKSGSNSSCVTTYNGVCQYSDSQYYNNGYTKIGYGQVSSRSNFSKFAARYTGVTYKNYGYGADQIQVQIQGNNITLISSALSSYYLPLQGVRFDDGTRRMYEFYYFNPMRYKIADLIFLNGQFDRGEWQLRYYTNGRAPVVIATGYMN